MSKEKKPQLKLYIAANGKVLTGAQADNARFDAKIKQLRKELPPPTTHITLRMPKTLPPVEQPTEPEDAQQNPSPEPSDAEDSECSDDEFDEHRPLTQQITPKDACVAPGRSLSPANESTEQGETNPSTQAVSSAKPRKVEVGAKGIDSKILEQEMKKTDSERKAKVSVTATGIDAELINVKSDGVKNEAKATVDINATAIEVKAANTESTFITTKASTKVDVTAKGISLKTGTCDQSVVNIEKEGSAEANVEAGSGSIGTIALDAVKATLKARVSASTSGAIVEAGCAKATGVEVSGSVEVSAEARGADIQIGKADLKGGKVGAKASATAEAAGMEVQIGTVTASGAELTAEASATASTGTELKIANANFSAFNGVGAHAHINVRSGIKALNLEVGLNGQMGVEIAQGGLDIGNVVFRPGLPAISTKRGLNFGIGGSGRGGGGKKNSTSQRQGGSEDGGNTNNTNGKYGQGSGNGSASSGRIEGSGSKLKGGGGQGGTNTTSSGDKGGNGKASSEGQSSSQGNKMSSKKNTNGINGESKRGGANHDPSYPNMFKSSATSSPEPDKTNTSSAHTEGQRFIEVMFENYKPAFEEVRRHNLPSEIQVPIEKPNSVEEASDYVRRRINRHHQEIEKIHAKSSTSEYRPVGHYNSKEQQEETQKQEKCTKDHVHTMKCLISESGRKVQNIGGNIHQLSAN